MIKFKNVGLVLCLIIMFNVGCSNINLNSNKTRSTLSRENANNKENEKTFEVYVGDLNGDYHSNYCEYLGGSIMIMKNTEAENLRYNKCRVCNPNGMMKIRKK